MNIVKVIETRLESAVRFVKFLRMGKSDVQECEQIGPHGIDSNPVKDMVALYAPTLQQGEPVLIGYINKNQIADIGETRIFSTDEDGVEKTAIHLKNDGTMEVGGNTDNMVRYSQIEASVNELKDDLNDLKQVFQTWIPAPNDGGAALKGAAAAWFATPIVEDITGAKIDEIETL